MSRFVREHLDMLLRTEDGAAVVDSMRPRCTVSSLPSQIAAVKKLWFSLGIRHESFEATTRGALEFMRSRPDVFDSDAVDAFEEFCRDDVATQWRKQRDATYRTLTDDRDVDAVVRSIRLLPEYVATFKTNEEDQAKLKAASAKNLERKSAKCVEVADCNKLLERCATLARDPPNPYVLAAAVALFCGRRSIEVISCGSFRRCPENEFACFFSGAAKQRMTLEEEANPPEYIIPLLVRFREFRVAFNRVRREIDTEGMDNARAHAVHGAKLVEGARYLLRSDTAIFHDLRRIYAAITFEAFEHRNSLNLWLKKVLLHEDMSSSINYTRCRVRGKPQSLGPWAF